MYAQLSNILLIFIYTTLPVWINEYLQPSTDWIFAAAACISLLAPFIVLPRLHRFYSLLLALFLYLPTWADLGHRLLFDAPLNSSSLTGVIYTTPGEITEFFSTFFNGKILVFTLLTLLWIYLGIFKTRSLTSLHLSGLLKAFFLSVTAVSMLHLWASYVIIEYRFIPLQIYLNIRQILQNERDLKAIQTQLGKYNFAPIYSDFKDNTPQTFVIIIGESLHRGHMQLYGYHRPTTPQLSQRDDLLVFANVTAPRAATLSSLNTALSFADSYTFDGSILKGSIIDYFNAAGFTTYWLSNQYQGGYLDNLIALWGSKATHPHFINHDYWGERQAPYDEQLLPHVRQALQDSAPRKLIIIHLMGNHIQYKQRYPESFDHFSGTTDKSQTVAEYDNSVLYNDSIISQILHELEQQGGISYLLYISDHGQDVSDSPDSCLCHSPEATTPPMLEIPFILWLSPSYIQHRADFLPRAQRNLNIPYNTKDFIHSVIDLSNLHNTDYIPNKSIFAPH